MFSLHLCWQVKSLLSISTVLLFQINTNLQGQEDGFFVGDKGSEGVPIKMFGKGRERIQALQPDLKSEQRSL